MLEQIKCTKTYIGNSNVTSGNEYRVTITYKGKTIWFNFHDNIYNHSVGADFLDCLLRDAWAYDDNRDLYEFMENYGYTDLDGTVKKAFNGCKKQYNRVNKLFTEAEQELLYAELQALGY